MLNTVNKKYALPLFIVVVGILCGYFLTVIFSSNTTKKNTNQTNLPIITNQTAQNPELIVILTAKPSELSAIKGVPAKELKNAKSSNLEVIYTNNSSSTLTGVQVQIYSESLIKHKIGSSITATFNKEKSAINKHGTFDLDSVSQGRTGIATIPVYPEEPGVLKFYALITTNENIKGKSKPFSIIVR